mmetsp:Transcript_1600/g.6608  ORF Transcript_1600/g.6608 Transcript_1600/m.6608 type:complete len:270 (-) Transcript_1600:3805-4614(-)
MDAHAHHDESQRDWRRRTPQRSIRRHARRHLHPPDGHFPLQVHRGRRVDRGSQLSHHRRRGGERQQRDLRGRRALAVSVGADADGGAARAARSRDELLARRVGHARAGPGNRRRRGGERQGVRRARAGWIEGSKGSRLRGIRRGRGEGADDGEAASGRGEGPVLVCQLEESIRDRDQLDRQVQAAELGRGRRRQRGRRRRRADSGAAAVRRRQQHRLHRRRRLVLSQKSRGVQGELHHQVGAGDRGGAGARGGFRAVEVHAKGTGGAGE